MPETWIDHVETLVSMYAPSLAEKGIVCTVSRRYFETSVISRLGSRFDLEWDEQREQERFHGVPNRYRGILLRFSPIEKGLLKREWCKEYVIIVKRIDRTYRGQNPVCWEQGNEMVLVKVEKRLQRIRKQAQAHDPVFVCRDTWWDAVRYIIDAKYNYKRRILGKDREVAETVINVIGTLVLIALVAAFYVLLK